MKRTAQNNIHQQVVKLLHKEEPKEPQTIEQISAITYKKAQKTMDKLFNEFETVSMRQILEITNDLSSVIIDNNATLKSMSQIMSHDYYTHTHSINVGIYSMLFGKYKEFDREYLEKIGVASLLHDLGKITVEKQIITKHAKLTTEELEEMVGHPRAGYELALSFGIEDAEILSTIRSHHEKIDGTGYPDALIGDAIPYLAKVVSICDIFDALTSSRSYKKALSSFQALLLMREDPLFRGKLDKYILNDFIKMLGS